MGCDFCKKKCVPYPHQPKNKQLDICENCFQKAEAQSILRRNKVLLDGLNEEINILNKKPRPREEKAKIIEELKAEYAKDIKSVIHDLKDWYPLGWWLNDKRVGWTA